MEKKKVTTMVLKVDLQCHKCYKKVKKVLCKFPQIQDQMYDEKQNQVVIKVVCCSPEKIRDKICCKGGGAIKSIEIMPPQAPKSKETEKSPKQPEEKKETEKSKQPEEKKEPEKSVENPKNPVKPPTSPILLVPVVPVCQPPVRACPPPVRACCMDCYRGLPGGPCYSGYGPYIQYDGYYGRPVYDSYGSRGYCFSEENPSACTVM